jgi:hypothetical protein
VTSGLLQSMLLCRARAGDCGEKVSNNFVVWVVFAKLVFAFWGENSPPKVAAWLHLSSLSLRPLVLVR